VDVRDDTTSGDRGLDEGVELLVTADRELQVPGRDTLHLQVLAGVSGQFQNFGREVLEDGRRVHGCGRADAVAVVDGLLEEPMDAAHGELKPGLGRTRLGSFLGGRGFAALSSLAAFTSFA